MNDRKMRKMDMNEDISSLIINKKDCQLKILFLYLTFLIFFQLKLINGLRCACKYVLFQILGQNFKFLSLSVAVPGSRDP
jgi:hypothetical protein